MAGATGNATVSFTTTNPVANNGKIKVTFPAGFDVSGATFGSVGGTLDGTATVSVAGQVVTITRTGGTTLAGGAAGSIVLGGIKNPTVSGSTGTYSILTTTSADVSIDTDAAVTADTITPGALTATNVQPASLVASATGNATVTFTTTNPVANNGKIKVTFPAGFNVSGAGFGSVGGTLDGTATVSVAGQVVTITRTGGTTLAGGATGSVVLTGITNPGTTGSTGTYAILTTTSGDVSIDTDPAVAADTITGGALTGTNVEPASLVAGATGNATVSFTTTNAVLNNGKIKVTFPAGFDVSGAGFGSVGGTLDGTATVSVAGQVVTITRTGGTTLAGGAAGSIVLTGIKNPTVSGSTGTYAITTTNAADANIDTEAAVTADTITPGALTGTNVEPASLVAGATGNATVSFTTTNPVANNGKIKVTFPAGFDVSGATFGSVGGTLDGTATVSVAGQVVTITRTGGTTLAGGAAGSIVLGGIKNPTVSGSTGTYSILTTTSADVSIDTDAAVTADTITPGALTATNVQPASLVASATGNATVTFTTTNPVANNGKIKVTFPAGFNVSGAGFGSVGGTLDGTATVSVAGQVVTITRTGGTTLAGGATGSVVLTGITNPGTTGSTGTYAILTTTSGDVSIDTDPAVAADTITSAPTTAGAATGIAITPGNQQLSVAFTAPASDGGSAITTYQYSTDGGATWLNRQTGTTASPLLITTLSADGATPLSNGTTYPVQIRAVNGVGNGAATASVNGTPATTPGAPTALVITPGGNQLSVAFTAPASDGGSAITSYQYSTDGGTSWLTRQTGTTASPLVITTLSTDGTTPLVNGTTYPVQLRALNALGNGPATASTNGTPAPQIVSATTSTDGTQIIITFDTPMGDPAGKHGEFSFSDGTGRTFTGAALGAPTTKIVLTVNGDPIVAGDPVTVSYVAGTVVAADNGPLASFTNQPVTNATADLTIGGGGGGGGGGGPISLNPVAPTVQDNLNIAVPGFDPVTQFLTQGSTTTISTLVVNVRNDGPDERQTVVTLQVPPSAVPGGERIVVQSVQTIDSLLRQAPLPATQGRVLSAVSAQVFNAQNVAIKTEFAVPVGISAIVPPIAIPQGAIASNFTMAFWDGNAWIDVPSRAQFMPDGSVRVDADVTHFTLYSVKYRGVRGYVAPAVYGAGSVGAVVFEAGGTFEELVLATRREGASAVWAQDRNGIYRLLIIDGPDFLKAEFFAAFPEGFPNFTAMIVVRESGANEASPNEGPLLGEPSVAPRTPVSAPQTPAASTGGTGIETRYTVTGADTLSDIALRFGVNWLDLANANGISAPNYVVRPGQTLVIPAGGSAPTTYTVTGTDTLSDIATRFGVNWLDLATLNGIAGPNYVVWAGQVLTIPGG